MSKRSKVTIMIAAIVMMSSLIVGAVFGQDRYLNTEDEVMTAEVLVGVSLYIQQERSILDERPYSIVVAIPGGNIKSGDRVAMGIAGTDEEFEYVYSEEDERDLGEEFVDFWFTYEEIRKFAEHGMDYINVNDVYYEFDKKQIDATKILAKKALIKS